MDRAARRVLASPLNRTARMLDQPWIDPNHVTAAGLVLGVVVTATAGPQFLSLALVL